MNQRLFRSLTAAVVVSAVSTSLPAQAQQIDRLEALLQQGEDADRSSPSAATTTADEASPSTQVTAASGPDRLSDLFQVIPHPLDNRQAATLYVRNIPVLTFIGPALPALTENKSDSTETSAADVELEPAVRATAIAARLDQFHQAEGDPEAIAVRWDEEQATYILSMGETDLVAIGETAILPDTTEDAAGDALQAANRLRRLLGGAAPLDTIEGLPEPTEAVPTSATDGEQVAAVMTGRASWYGPGFHGRPSASGETFNQNALTAAHRTLPFGTRVRVTNLSNNQQVIVRINDRGPYGHGRIIDLSAAAARAIDLARMGVGSVRLEVLSE